MKEFKTPKQALQYCRKNNIPFENIKRATKLVEIKRQWNNIVYRQYMKEIVIYKV